MVYVIPFLILVKKSQFKKTFIIRSNIKKTCCEKYSIPFYNRNYLNKVYKIG